MDTSTMDRKEKRRKISEQFIFSWQPQRNTFRTFFAFAVFSAMIHFLGFYLFQVGYPPAVRPELAPSNISLLDPQNQNVRSMMQRARDRMVFIEPPSASSDAQLTLSDQAIRFVPTFAEVKPALKRPGNNEAEVTFSISEPPSQVLPENWNNPVEFSPILVKRGVAPNTILDDYLDLIPNLPRIRVNFTVVPSGLPTEVQIVGNQFGENKKILEEAIERFLRFNPIAEEEGNYPGWIQIDGKNR